MMARAVTGAAAMAAAFVVTSAVVGGLLGGLGTGGWFAAMLLTILVGLVFFGNDPERSTGRDLQPYVPSRPALPAGEGHRTVQGTTVVINGDVHLHAAPSAEALPGPAAYAAAMAALISQVQNGAALPASPVVRGEIAQDERDTPAIENRRMP